MKTALQIIGLTWFVGATIVTMEMGDVFGFMHVVGIGHMVLGAGVAITGSFR